MSGRLTVWGASQLLTGYFGKSTEAPSSFWLALVRAIPPTPYLAGDELDEPDNVDYLRAEVPNDLANWSNDAAPQEILSLLPVTFVTASSDWGQIGYWALCNAQVGGYNLLVGDLENPQQVAAGDQVVVSEGDLSVTLGPFFFVQDE